MTLTRANLETILVKRASAYMSAAGMAITYVGTNADLNDPIGYALRYAGYTVADPAGVADADIAAIGDEDLDAVLDIAEFRLLKNISGNLALVDITTGPISEKLSQLSAALEKRIDKLSAEIALSYGAEIEVGAIHFDFATHGDDETE